MRTLVLAVAVLFATSAYAEQRSLSGGERPAEAVQSDAKGSDAKFQAKTEAKYETKSEGKSEVKSDEKKKPVAKKRETDEDKARRIAKRYGVTW